MRKRYLFFDIDGTLEITETQIRRTENGETHPYDYSLSEEGYLITYEDLYVFDKGFSLYHHGFWLLGWCST